MALNLSSRNITTWAKNRCYIEINSRVGNEKNEYQLEEEPGRFGVGCASGAKLSLCQIFAPSLDVVFDICGHKYSVAGNDQPVKRSPEADTCEEDSVG